MSALTFSPLLDFLLMAGLVLSGAILVLSVVAYRRRRTRSILFLVGAFAALSLHSVVDFLVLEGLLSVTAHDLVEHGLVLVQSVLLLAAVYYARTLERGDDGE